MPVDAPISPRELRRLDVVIAIIIRAGKILISQRRQQDTFGGYWEFPGGKREAAETPEQCLARELQEELCIEVERLSSLPPIEHEYPSMRVRLLPYVCWHAKGEPQPLAAACLEWVDPEDLRRYRFPEANAGLIEQIISSLSSGGIFGERIVPEPVSAAY